MYNTYTGTTVPNTYQTISNFNTYTGNTVTNAYGSLYENGVGTTVAVTNGGWTGWVTATAGATLLTTFTNNTTADRITITSGGTFLITANVSCISNSTGTVYYMSVFRNNSAITNLETSWSYNNNAERFSSSVTGIVTDVNATDFFDIRFQSNAGVSHNLTIYNTNLTINRIGY